MIEAYAMIVRTLPALLATGLAACSGDSTAPPVPSPVEEFSIAARSVRESSGLARSHRDPGIFWTQNDSGNAAEAYAIDERGLFAGTLVVTGATNVDWEDLASFVEGGRPRLLLADIGDNNANRGFVTLYVVDEPDATQRPFRIEAAPLRMLVVRYPDGPRDAEGVFVDAREGVIYILSKRDAVPRLYRVPLMSTTRDVTAEALGEIPVPRATDRDSRPKRINWVTSMDIDEKGTQLVMITMARAHLYRRAAGESWSDALRRAPMTFGLPDYTQIEGVAFVPAGDAIFVISEGSPAPFARIALPQR